MLSYRLAYDRPGTTGGSACRLGTRDRWMSSRTIRRCFTPTTRAGRSSSTCRPARSSRSTRCTSAPGSSSSTGRVEIEDDGGSTSEAGPGGLALTAPNERHEVRANDDSRLVLVLAPWPGEGHPSSDRAIPSGPTRSAGRSAVLYDIHGNLPALDAVIADARAAGARVLRARRRLRPVRRVAAETVARLRDLDAVWIRGNTDRWLEDASDAPGTPARLALARVLPRRARRGTRRTSSRPRCRRPRRSTARSSATPHRASDMETFCARTRPQATTSCSPTTTPT